MGWEEGMGLAEEVGAEGCFGQEDGVGRGVGAEGGLVGGGWRLREPVGRGGWCAEGPVGRGSDRSERGQRLFGCERSEPSCSGPGSVERSGALSKQLVRYKVGPSTETTGLSQKACPHPRLAEFCYCSCLPLLPDLTAAFKQPWEHLLAEPCKSSQAGLGRAIKALVCGLFFPPFPVGHLAIF